MAAVDPVRINVFHPEIAHLARSLRGLKPFPGNAKMHDIPALQESLRVNGQYKPIIVSKGAP